MMTAASAVSAWKSDEISAYTSLSTADILEQAGFYGVLPLAQRVRRHCANVGKVGLDLFQRIGRHQRLVHVGQVRGDAPRAAYHLPDGAGRAWQRQSQGERLGSRCKQYKSVRCPGTRRRWSGGSSRKARMRSRMGWGVDGDGVWRAWDRDWKRVRSVAVACFKRASHFLVQLSERPTVAANSA